MASIDRLLEAMDATPALICDGLAWSLFHEQKVDPVKVEQLMERRGFRTVEGESIRDCVCRHYGSAVADLMEALL